MDGKHFEDLNLNCSKALKWILKKWGFCMWAGFVWLRIALLVGSYEHSNESSI
jgi:hypothetical protein